MTGKEIFFAIIAILSGLLCAVTDGMGGEVPHSGKDYSRHWLAANMSNEAFLGFTAFNSRKITGKDTIDFIKYRQLIAKGRIVDEDFFAEVLPKPKE